MEIYNFDYNDGEASVTFEVDKSIFTNEIANETLHFFDWFYDKDEDSIEEVMKKYAIEAIRVATINCCDVNGVIHEFMSHEGFAKLDGSIGIKLIQVEAYQFDENQLLKI